MEQTQQRPIWRLSTYDLAVAGIFGAIAIVLSFTPLGLIPVPNPTGAATTLHIPAIIAGIVAGPVVGALVGLVLAISSWARYSGTFVTFAGGNVFVALLAAFLPRILIGVVAYYVYRLLRRWFVSSLFFGALVALIAAIAAWVSGYLGIMGLSKGNSLLAILVAFLWGTLIGVGIFFVYYKLRPAPAVPAIAASLAGTLTNSVGVLGLLMALGTMPPALLVPVFAMNVPLEATLAVMITLPTIAVLRARRPGSVAAARD